MRKVVNKNLVIFSLVLVLCVPLLWGYKSFNNKKEIPEKYKTNNERKQFAMFIKNNENNQYETYEGDEFPEGYRANLNKSICTDINGNIIKDVISNSENGITVTSNKTVYCEIYLDEKGVLGSDLVNNQILGVLEPTGIVEDELVVRYYGTNPDNYICFGTKDKATCIGEQDKYMYRIIGVDKSGRYKVIKKEALNTAYAWYSSSLFKDITWPESDLYNGLNGSYFLSNTTYMSSDWSDKIEKINWKYGDVLYNGPLFDNATEAVNVTATEVLQKEQSLTTTTSAKIGLMYLTDYVYAYQKLGLNCSKSGQYTTCKTSWINLSQNDTSAPNEDFEWPMSRYGFLSGTNYYMPWSVGSDGAIKVYWNMAVTGSVRPVFYLKTNIEIKGTGAETDPYIITN